MLKQRFLFQNSLFLCWQRRPSSDWFRAVNWLFFITCPPPLALKSCRRGLELYYARQGAKPHKSLHPHKPFCHQMVGLSVANGLPKWQMVPWWGKTHYLMRGPQTWRETCNVSEEASWESKQADMLRGAWTDPSYSLPQLGCVPVGACVRQGRRREGEGEFQTCLTSYWEDGYPLCRARECTSSASSKQMHLHLLSRACKR